MNLQPSVRRGDARAVEVSVKVLDHKAKINNYRPYGRRPEIAVQTNVSVIKHGLLTLYKVACQFESTSLRH